MGKTAGAMREQHDRYRQISWADALPFFMQYISLISGIKGINIGDHDVAFKFFFLSKYIYTPFL